MWVVNATMQIPLNDWKYQNNGNKMIWVLYCSPQELLIVDTKSCISPLILKINSTIVFLKLLDSTGIQEFCFVGKTRDKSKG